MSEITMTAEERAAYREWLVAYFGPHAPDEEPIGDLGKDIERQRQAAFLAGWRGRSRTLSHLRSAAAGPLRDLPPAFVQAGAACYLDDMRDGMMLSLRRDDQGDMYVSVLPEGHKIGPTVRLCASGGAAERAPGLLRAMRQAHEAVRGAAVKAGTAGDA